MKNFLISLSGDKIVFPVGMIESIAEDVRSDVSKLIVFSGLPGTGKTVGIEAVIDNLKSSKDIDHHKICRLNSHGGASHDPIHSPNIAINIANKLAINKKGLYIVAWDEILGLEAEFEAIDQLIGKGYTVIVGSQDVGLFHNQNKNNFSTLAEFQGGVE